MSKKSIRQVRTAITVTAVILIIVCYITISSRSQDKEVKTEQNTSKMIEFSAKNRINNTDDNIILRENIYDFDECTKTLERIDEIINEYSDTCSSYYSSIGCYPPNEMLFEMFSKGSEWRTYAEQSISECKNEFGASAAQLDCSEFPCVAILNQDIVGDGCDSLREIFDQDLPELYDSLTSQIGESWVPIAPSQVSELGHKLKDGGPIEGMYLSRLNFRAVKISERLIADTSLTQEDSNSISDCKSAQITIDNIKDGSSPCEDISEYWGCQEPDSRVSESSMISYSTKALSVHERIIEKCADIDSENSMVDCSMLPCIILYRHKEKALGDSSFCGLVGEVHSIHPPEGNDQVSVGVIWSDVNGLDNKVLRFRWDREKYYRIYSSAQLLYPEE